jgi:hypothetical protein
MMRNETDVQASHTTNDELAFREKIESFDKNSQLKTNTTNEKDIFCLKNCFLPSIGMNNILKSYLDKSDIVFSYSLFFLLYSFISWRT